MMANRLGGRTTMGAYRLRAKFRQIADVTPEWTSEFEEFMVFGIKDVTYLKAVEYVIGC